MVHLLASQIDGFNNLLGISSDLDEIAFHPLLPPSPFLPTEFISGTDLVEWQIKVAGGARLPKLQDELKIIGHAFEARIYAEDPQNNFMPTTGLLTHHQPPPTSQSVRVDTGVRTGMFQNDLLCILNARA